MQAGMGAMYGYGYGHWRLAFLASSARLRGWAGWLALALSAVGLERDWIGLNRCPMFGTPAAHWYKAGWVCSHFPNRSGTIDRSVFSYIHTVSRPACCMLRAF
jgi:hypothetical protein